MSRELGQQVNVINRPGGGQVALGGFKSAEPNGDMFFFGAVSGITLNPQINPALFNAQDGLRRRPHRIPGLDGGADRPAAYRPQRLIAHGKNKGGIKYALSPGRKF